MLRRAQLLFASSLIAASLAASAGTVDVVFVNTSSYWDAGNTSFDEPANLLTLNRHLYKLGQRHLPADQVLKIEVLQVDLAGTIGTFLGPVQVRTISGNTDMPKIHMRYVLSSGSRTITSSEEWVVDLDYTHGLANRGDSKPLFYEKRMLDGWFKKRFVDGLASPG